MKEKQSKQADRFTENSKVVAKFITEVGHFVCIKRYNDDIPDKSHKVDQFKEKQDYLQCKLLLPKSTLCLVDADDINFFIHLDHQEDIHACHDHKNDNKAEADCSRDKLSVIRKRFVWITMIFCLIAVIVTKTCCDYSGTSKDHKSQNY